jgi:hypothetical protein
MAAMPTRGLLKSLPPIEPNLPDVAEDEAHSIGGDVVLLMGQTSAE